MNSYTVMSSPWGQEVTVGAHATTVPVSGLTVGTQYAFTMKATNEYGDSVNSAVAVCARDKPWPSGTSGRGDGLGHGDEMLNWFR